VAKSLFLTKTAYVQYLTCPAWAWLEQHHPEQIPPVDPVTLRAQERGNRIEALATQQFPDGVLIDGERMEVAARRTTEAIRAGARTIFQATAITKFGLLAQADVLHRDDDGWHLYEIKSSTASKSEPRRIQKRYLADISFQVHAFTDIGLDIASASILHLNNTYRRNGALALDQLFQVTDMTHEVRGVYGAVGRSIETAYAVLRDSGNRPECLCHLKAKSNRCDLFTTFHPEFPETNSVLELNVGKEKLQQVLDLGVTSLLDWPEHVPLTDRQRETVRFRRGGEERIDVAKLRAILDGYEFPLYFYDYETFAAPVPLHPGLAPFEAVPFQYSLHIVGADGSVRHHHFLWTERDVDPVPELAGRICSQIGPTGTLVAWNAGYEMGCNTRMAERFPEFRHAFADFNRRTVDLGDIVKHGAWQHPKFRGSWSLKTVLPVVSPELDYKYLDIGEGGAASEQWMQAVLDDESIMSDTEREAIFAALRDYCERDTLAMVHVWRRANELAGNLLPVQL
jgi:hypothetical protein